jgi:hypothetical protein
METDKQSFGELFYTCCEEVADISFMQALYRILTLAADRLKHMGTFCEKNGGCLLRCNHGCCFAVCWLVKEQIGDRLIPIPKVERLNYPT